VYDDILPLGKPLVLADGQTTDHILVPANQSVTIPITAINRMRALWGPDAHEFKPERWLEGGVGIPDAAKAVQGHRHLLTFMDGPRTYDVAFMHPYNPLTLRDSSCIGKGFSIAEFKASAAELGGLCAL
jgi:cytochrome P450